MRRGQWPMAISSGPGTGVRISRASSRVEASSARWTSSKSTAPPIPDAGSGGPAPDQAPRRGCGRKAPSSIVLALSARPGAGTSAQASRNSWRGDGVTAQRGGAGDAGALPRGELGQPAQQAGLAHARVAGDLQHRAPARGQRRGPLRPCARLGFPPDQRLPALWRTRWRARAPPPRLSNPDAPRGLRISVSRTRGTWLNCTQPRWTETFHSVYLLRDASQLPVAGRAQVADSPRVGSPCAVRGSSGLRSFTDDASISGSMTLGARRRGVVLTASRRRRPPTRGRHRPAATAPEQPKRGEPWKPPASAPSRSRPAYPSASWRTTPCTATRSPGCSRRPGTWTWTWSPEAWASSSPAVRAVTGSWCWT